jgi:hypothetical protein
MQCDAACVKRASEGRNERTKWEAVQYYGLGQYGTNLRLLLVDAHRRVRYRMGRGEEKEERDD